MPRFSNTGVIQKYKAYILPREDAIISFVKLWVSKAIPDRPEICGFVPPLHAGKASQKRVCYTCDPHNKFPLVAAGYTYEVIFFEAVLHLRTGVSMETDSTKGPVM